MIVVADASPLIFLAKIRRLNFIQTLLGNDIHVPTAVRDEVLAPPIDPVEASLLHTFLKNCQVELVRRPRVFATSMSRADNEALTLAIRRKAHVLLCDERTTRIMAEAEGIRPLGTLGLLLRARVGGHIAPQETKKLLDRLVGSHGFRISVELYQAALAAIEK